jgi:hypothetical protein
MHDRDFPWSFHKIQISEYGAVFLGTHGLGSSEPLLIPAHIFVSHSATHDLVLCVFLSEDILPIVHSHSRPAKLLWHVHVLPGTSQPDVLRNLGQTWGHFEQWHHQHQA